MVPLDACLDPIGTPRRSPCFQDPLGIPLNLDHQTNSITKRPVEHLDFCRVSLGLARSYHTLHFISRTFLGQFGLFLGVAELKNVK